jgi:outer membrane protein assembly factor BamE (lipoprotein component of BamABCDE complex)
MVSRRSTWFLSALLLLSMLALADDKKSSSSAKMDEVTRMQLIRAINSEIVYIRRPFPMGYKGLVVKNGVVSPSESEVQNMIALYGPAVKPGDQARITSIEFKGDNKIVFEINGGPKKKQKWYDRIQVGTGNASVSNPNANPNLNARGSSVTLEFDKYVPNIGPDELKKALYPVFDFNAKSAIEAYIDTVPPKVKEAIKNKQVLVGMNREMVTYALGRPPKKYREQNYEEWIYGAPPDPVQFVRFVGDEVVQLEIMKVDGQKIVRTEKEVDLKATVAQAQPAAAAESQAQPASQSANDSGQATKRPTLKRPGEAAPPVPDGHTGKLPMPGDSQRGPGADPSTSPAPAGPPGSGGPPGSIPPV